MRPRNAEEHHHLVTDVPVELAVIALDDLGDRLEVAIQQGGDVLGVEPFRERGEATDVREEHRDLLALFAVGPIPHVAHVSPA